MVTVITDLYTVFGIVSIGLGIFLVEELLGLVLGRVAKREPGGKTVVRDIRVGLRILALGLVVSNVLNFLGYSSLSTTLTVSGVAAIAASLALQNTLTNVISGLLLLSDGLIHLNDEVEYSSMRGNVVRIGLRNTWVRTKDGDVAVVSNSSLSGGPLVNYSAKARLSKKYAFD